MRLGWAVTTDHFSSRAPNATQHECCKPGPILLCMGLFSRFCVRALRCTAHSVSKTRVNALAEALRCVRDTRSLVHRAYCESIHLPPIPLMASGFRADDVAEHLPFAALELHHLELLDRRIVGGAGVDPHPGKQRVRG